MKYKVRFDVRLRQKDGTYLRMLNQGILLEHDPNGKFLRTLMMHTDITYLKQEGKPVLAIIGMDGEPSYLDAASKNIFRDRLEQLFKAHLAENLPTLKMAAKLKLSARTLAKRCRELVGRSPAEALRHYKMEYAADALRQSTYSIKEISFRLGFQHPCHFSRVFRQHLGEPPSHYRARAKRERLGSVTGRQRTRP